MMGRPPRTSCCGLVGHLVGPAFARVRRRFGGSRATVVFSSSSKVLEPAAPLAGVSSRASAAVSIWAPPPLFCRPLPLSLPPAGRGVSPLPRFVASAAPVLPLAVALRPRGGPLSRLVGPALPVSRPPSRARSRVSKTRSRRLAVVLVPSSPAVALALRRSVSRSVRRPAPPCRTRRSASSDGSRAR